MKRRMTQLGVLALAAGLICSIAVAQKEMQKKAPKLPDAVKAALMKMYPGATIEEAEKEAEACKVYEVEVVLADGKEVEATVAMDGTIMEIENEMKADELPAAVTAKLPANAKVKEAASEKTLAVFAPVALTASKVTYEVVVMVDGKEKEMTFAPDGTIVSDDDGDDDDEDEGDDDGDNEKPLSIDAVPAEVKATLLAQRGDIKEIEMENENGKVVYEAEILIDGKVTEFKVDPAGKVLGKETEDDDEGDDKD